MATFSPNRPQKRRRMNLVTLLMAALLFLIVLGALAMWIIVNIGREQSMAAAASAVSETVLPFDERDNKNLLLITSYEKEPVGFVLLHGSPKDNTMTAAALSGYTDITGQGAGHRLTDIYKKQGAAALPKVISEKLNIAVEHYLALDMSGVEGVLHAFGSGVACDIPQDIRYRFPDGASLVLSAGRQNLTARQASLLMRYAGWERGDRQQTRIQADLAAAFINQYMNAGCVSQMDSSFSTIINQARSDVKVSHYTNVKDALTALAISNKGDVCSVSEPDGQYSGNGDSLVFTLSDQSRKALQKQFETFK